MKYNSMTKKEQTYYEGLSNAERRIYLASADDLDAIDTWGSVNVQSYVSVARIANELERLYTAYKMYKEDSAGNSSLASMLLTIYSEVFSVHISIGQASAVWSLLELNEDDEPLEELKAFKNYLAKIKMKRFEYLSNNMDIEVLVEIIGYEN